MQGQPSVIAMFPSRVNVDRLDNIYGAVTVMINFIGHGLEFVVAADKIEKLRHDAYRIKNVMEFIIDSLLYIEVHTEA